MMTMSRRGFLASGAAAASTLVLASGVGMAQAPVPLRMGAQSYSFRKFTFEETLRMLKELGLNEMEFTSRHINQDDLAGVNAALNTEGVKAVGYGVVGFGGDAAANRKTFELGKALGVEFLSADPRTESFDNVDQLAQEFGIQVAIHNHGPARRYDKIDDVLRVCEGRSPLLGACYDTGHSIRSGEKPHEAIRRLGKRLLALHLKDRVYGGEEKEIGEGDMDLVETVRALREIEFTGPIVMEFEVVPENPVYYMARGLAKWNQAIEQA